jgi:hypothetical protein
MVPYRTFLLLGLAVGALGAGYAFAPETDAAALSTVAMPEAAPVASSAVPAAPTAKPSSTLVANRPPVPIVTRARDKYYVPKATEASVQTASAAQGATAPGSNGAANSDISPASLTFGGAADGGLLPADGATSGDSSRAKAAVELDGYKNVRGLEKGPDGIWRGRAMRGRTEIAIRVDDSGNVSAQ